MSKPTKWPVRPAKTQISLAIRQDWSEPSLFTRRSNEYLATHWAHSDDSDQTGRMLRLIWVFAQRTSFCWFCYLAAQTVTIWHHCSKKTRRKVTKLPVHPAKTQINLGIYPVWSVFAVHLKRVWVLSYRESPKWRLRLGIWPGWCESLLITHVILLVLSCSD